MVAIMGNVSVHSHNSVPVADSWEARGATPLWIPFYKTIFSFPRPSFYSSSVISSTSRNYYFGLIWRNLVKSSHKYDNTSQGKKFIKSCMFNNANNKIHIHIPIYIYIFNQLKENSYYSHYFASITRIIFVKRTNCFQLFSDKQSENGNDLIRVFRRMLCVINVTQKDLARDPCK